MRTRDNFYFPGPSTDEFQVLLPQQLHTRWLETTDIPDKLQALEKSELKLYIENAESIRPVLGRVWHLVGEFWENFERGCSTVLGHRISVAQQDLSRATGLPNKGHTVGYWAGHKNSIIRQIGKEAWKVRHTRRLKKLCGPETKFMEKFPVDMIKDDTVRYVASVVMDDLVGFSTVSHCSDEFLDAIQEGMNGNVTNWLAHIPKRMKKLKRKSLISRTNGYNYQFPYGVVIGLLIRKQAPHLWQQAIENEGQDIELLKKRRFNEINGVQDIEEGNIEDVEGYQYAEKRPKLTLALLDLEEDGGNEDSEVVQMQELVTIQSDNDTSYMRDLTRQSDANMKDMRELNQVKVDLQNMANEKYELENKLQEKEDHLQKVVDSLEKLNEEKRIAEDENSELSKAFVERDRALKQVKLEKILEMKHKEKIISSLQETVQALQEKLRRSERKQRDFQILVKREVEKETAQIRSTLTDVLGLKQGDDLIVGAQKQVEKLRNHRLKSDHFMLVVSSNVGQSTEEPYLQTNNKGTNSDMNGDKRTGATNHLLRTSDTDALHCSICMEEWTTAGDHRICSLACGHMFGMSCIREWLQRLGKNTGKCPQCNDKAKLTDIRTLYVPVIAVSGVQ